MRLLLWGLAALLAGLLTACGGAAPAGTPVPASTATPAATATPTGPLPRVGDTIENFEDWTFSLAKMEPRDKLIYDALGTWYTPSGQFWFLWLDQAPRVREQPQQGALDLE